MFHSPFLNTDGGHVKRKFDILSDISEISQSVSAHTNQSSDIKPGMLGVGMYEVLMLRKFEID